MDNMLAMVRAGAPACCPQYKDEHCTTDWRKKATLYIHQELIQMYKQNEVYKKQLYQ